MIFRAKKYQKCRLIILTLWLENSKKRKTIYSNVIFGVKIQIYRKITLKRFWIFAPKNNKKVGWKIWPFFAWKFNFMQNYPRKQKLFWQFLAWKFKRNIFFHFPSFSGNFSLFFSKRRISAKNGDKWAHESGTDCRTDFWHHHKTNSSQNLGLSP